MLPQSSSLVVQSPALQYAPNLIPKGFGVGIVDVKPQQFEISRLVLCSFKLIGEVDDIFAEMRNQANMCGGNLGLSDGQRMLDNRREIPVGFMPYYILLPGTELVDERGHKYIGYLKCSNSAYNDRSNYNNWRRCVTNAYFFKMFSGMCKFACI